MHRKRGRPNREIAEYTGEDCGVVGAWPADVRKGASPPFPGGRALARRKNAAQGMPGDNGGGAQWAAGGRLQGQLPDVQVAVPARQEAGSRPYVRGSRKGLQGDGPARQDPAPPRPLAASPEERIARQRKQGGAGGERQGRARDRIRGRGPRAGAQERACDGVVQGRAAGPRAERGARPPGPVRSRGRGISAAREGGSGDAKRRLAGRERTRGLFGKAV